MRIASFFQQHTHIHTSSRGRDKIKMGRKIPVTKHNILESRLIDQTGCNSVVLPQMMGRALNSCLNVHEFCSDVTIPCCKTCPNGLDLALVAPRRLVLGGDREFEIHRKSGWGRTALGNHQHPRSTTYPSPRAMVAARSNSAPG